MAFSVPKGMSPLVAMNNGNSSVRVSRLVMIPPALIDKSGFFQPLYEFVCCHKIPIRIIRISVKIYMRIVRMFIGVCLRVHFALFKNISNKQVMLCH